MGLGYRVVRAAWLGNENYPDEFEMFRLFAKEVAGLVKVGQSLQGYWAEPLEDGRLKAVWPRPLPIMLRSCRMHDMHFGSKIKKNTNQGLYGLWRQISVL